MACSGGAWCAAGRGVVRHRRERHPQRRRARQGYGPRAEDHDQAGSGLSKDEVEKLQREAELHAAEDKARRDDIETRNTADSLAYSAEKTIRDNADKISDELKTEVEGKVAAVRTALEGTDAAAVKTATDELQASMLKIGEAVYAPRPPVTARPRRAMARRKPQRGHS